MAEIPQFNPEKFAHENGNFSSDVHTPEFQKELREAGEKTEEEKIEEIKKELFDQEVPAKYKDLIEKDYTYFLENDAHYEENLHGWFRDKLSFITDEVKNKIVLDLGCGHCEAFAMGEDEETGKIIMPYNLYVGVDLSPGLPWADVSTESSTIGDDLSLPKENPVPIKPKEPEQKKRIPDAPGYELDGKLLLVKDDMLRAVSRVKSGSVKLIIMSGMEIGNRPHHINTLHLGRDLKDNRDTKHPTYMEALHSEIKRVLEDDGLFINWRSDIWWDDDPEMVRVKIDEWSWNKTAEEEVLRKQSKRDKKKVEEQKDPEASSG